MEIVTSLIMVLLRISIDLTTNPDELRIITTITFKETSFSLKKNRSVLTLLHTYIELPIDVSNDF